MSSSLSVYLLDVAATRALVGSRDDQLLNVIRAEFGDDLTRDDDYHSHAIEQGSPTADEALSAVIHGGPFSENRDHAFQYSYAYQRICTLTGAFLPNDCFTPHKGDWLSVVDQGLEALGITAVSVDSFSHSDPCGSTALHVHTGLRRVGSRTRRPGAPAVRGHQTRGRRVGPSPAAGARGPGRCHAVPHLDAAR